MADPHRDRLVYPRLGRPPESAGDLLGWARELHEELSIFFRRADSFLVDRQLVGHAERRTVAAGFQIVADAPFIYLNSALGVLSHLTAAISDGTPGQFLVLINEGANNISIATNANTKFPGGVAITLGPDDGVLLGWSPAGHWVALAPVGNN